MYDENDFLKALSQSFKNYLEYGARSTEKLKPIHLFLANTLQNIFGEGYQTHYLGENSTSSPTFCYWYFVGRNQRKNL